MEGEKIMKGAVHPMSRTILHCVFCVWIIALQPASATAAAPATQPWQADVRRRIHEAASLLAERKRLDASLKEHGFPKGGSNDAVYRWLETNIGNEELMKQHTRLMTIPSVEVEIMGLWFWTGDPANIPTISETDLVDKGESIIQAYRKLLDERVNLTREASLRLSLRATVEAMRSQYAPVAVSVMQLYIDFGKGHHSACVDWGFEPSTCSPKVATQYWEVWHRWYLAHERDLRWYGERDVFTRVGGNEFDPVSELPSSQDIGWSKGTTVKTEKP